MKTRKIKLSGNENARYVSKMGATGTSGSFSLHRIKGLVHKEALMSPEIMSHAKKKADMTIIFPSVDVLEELINDLLVLRVAMMAKECQAARDEPEEELEESYFDILRILAENLSRGTKGVSPEQIIQSVRANQRAAKGRAPGEIRSLTSTVSRLASRMDKLEKYLQRMGKSPSENKEKKPVEPAVQ